MMKSETFLRAFDALTSGPLKELMEDNPDLRIDELDDEHHGDALAEFARSVGLTAEDCTLGELYARYCGAD